MNKKTNAYQVITDRIIELLEQGTVPWHKPWQTFGEAMNIISKKPYRGINQFLLNCSEYDSPYWLTFNQAKKLGGSVCKGQKSTPVVFWKWFEVEDPDTGEKSEKPFLRYYRVFNLEQTEGIEAPAASQEPTRQFSPIETCERIVRAIPNPPRIVHKKQAAWYSPSKDLVNMPKQNTFTSDEEYYSTLFHELTHASGHQSRLNRKTITEKAAFGSKTYAQEELVAEMGAAMLCGAAGIENRTIDNSAAYLQGWLKRLRQDNRLIVVAASQAQKAADYMRGVPGRQTRQGESQA